MFLLEHLSLTALWDLAEQHDGESTSPCSSFTCCQKHNMHAMKQVVDSLADANSSQL